MAKVYCDCCFTDPIIPQPALEPTYCSGVEFAYTCRLGKRYSIRRSVSAGDR